MAGSGPWHTEETGWRWCWSSCSSRSCSSAPRPSCWPRCASTKTPRRANARPPSWCEPTSTPRSNELLAALAGSSTIVDDDNFGVDLDRWQAVRHRGAGRVGRQLTRARGDGDRRRRRADFEASFGPDRGAERGRVGSSFPPPRRPTYLPVARRRARDRGQPPASSGSTSRPSPHQGDGGERCPATTAAVVISEPVIGQSLGPAVVLRRSSRSTDSAPRRQNEEQRIRASIGFVTTTVTGPNLVEQRRTAAAERDTRFSIQDGDTVVGSTDPAPHGGTTTTRRVVGREAGRWSSTTARTRTTRWRGSSGSATLLITGAVAIAAVDPHSSATPARGGRRSPRPQRRPGPAAGRGPHHGGRRRCRRTEVPPLLDALTASVRILDDSQAGAAGRDQRGTAGVAGRAGPDARQLEQPTRRAVLERRWILLEDVAQARWTTTPKPSAT